LDYAKFLQMYLNLGEFNGQRILRESTIDTIMANQEVQPRESTWHQGLAIGVQKADEENPEARGAFFWGGYFNTTYTADPETGTIGILMKQTFGANEPTTQQFNDFVFATSD
jgi:CubicO group peptidase (beta-lactamase class C family)